MALKCEIKSRYDTRLSNTALKTTFDWGFLNNGSTIKNNGVFDNRTRNKTQNEDSSKKQVDKILTLWGS